MFWSKKKQIESISWNNSSIPMKQKHKPCLLFKYIDAWHVTASVNFTSNLWVMYTFETNITSSNFRFQCFNLVEIFNRRYRIYEVTVSKIVFYQLWFNRRMYTFCKLRVNKENHQQFVNDTNKQISSHCIRICMCTFYDGILNSYRCEFSFRHNFGIVGILYQCFCCCIYFFAP